MGELDKVLARVNQLDKSLSRIEGSRQDAIDRERAQRLARAAVANHQLQLAADSALQPHGVTCPPPMADESNREYRSRIARTLQNKLPLQDEGRQVRYDSFPRDAFMALWPSLLKSVQSSARDPDLVAPDDLKEVTTIDRNSGLRVTEFIGPRSWIYDAKRPLQKVTGGLLKYFLRGGSPGTEQARLLSTGKRS